MEQEVRNESKQKQLQYIPAIGAASEEHTSVWTKNEARKLSLSTVISRATVENRLLVIRDKIMATDFTLDKKLSMIKAAF